MNHRPLDQLLGSDRRDPGCDAGLEFFDEYCEAVERGDPLSDRFTDFITHLSNCVTCREDTESLIAVLRDQRERGEGVEDRETR
jgi:hypothetical protein